MPPPPTRAAPRRALRRAVSGTPGALLVTAAVACLAMALVPHALSRSGADRVLDLPWWLLTAMFAAVELSVLYVQRRREAQSVSLAQIPLVVGLLLASPAALVVGRVAGALLVFAVHRRMPPLKLAYNAALALADVALALTVFSALAGAPDATEPRTWLAGYAAALASDALDTLATWLVVAAYERQLHVREGFDEWARDAAQSVAVATLGLIAALALTVDVLAAVPLLGACALMTAGYRRYASLSDRHASMERLYRLSRDVATGPLTDQVVRTVLVSVRDLLHAERVQLLLLAGDGPAARTALDAQGDRLGAAVPEPVPSGSLTAHVARTGRGALLPRGAAGDAGEELRRLRLREAVLAPLQGEGGVFGILVAGDRAGGVRTFLRHDLTLLETVANQAAVALQNGRLIERLRHEALHDALTGLPNRAYVRHELAAALAAPVTAGHRVAVLILDLNGFKEVNDTLGHQQGDELLVEVSARLRDAAGSDAVVARLGGDEFAVVLTAMASDDAAVARARLLLASFAHPVELDGVPVEIAAAIGVSGVAEPGDDVSELLRRADLAMYAAKASSDGIRLYHPGMDSSSPQRLALVGELRTALEQDQLQVHVQPKVGLRTGEVAGVEALVRWTHPSLGALPPDEFIPVAERTGLIGPLTRAVLRQSLAGCAQWRRAGHDIGVAVNLSARSLTDPSLIGDVADELRRHGVPPGLLTLEITESSVMTDPVRTGRVLLQLRQIGVRLAVDDFGTGYSSLSYLRRLPIDEVKIDKGFVTHLLREPDDAAIVRSIIDLAGHLALEVVAEGVEDAATQQWLTEHRCSYGQGWQIARPMPVEDLLPWLAAYDDRRAQAQSWPSRAASASSRVPA